MRDVKGYVFVADWQTSQCLLGRHPDPECHQRYELFESNNFLTFETLEQTQEGIADYLHMVLVDEQEYQPHDYKRVGSISPREIDMRIAESPEEIPSLQNGKLVVIMNNYGIRNDNVLLGPRVKDKPFFCKNITSRITDTDFKTFHSLEEARKIASEISRQTECPTTIAKFLLRRIS